MNKKNLTGKAEDVFKEPLEQPAIPQNLPFSYVYLLENLIARGCNFLTAKDVFEGIKILANKPNIVIRHEWDRPSPIGGTMVEAEARLGIRSTFYITPQDILDDALSYIRQFQQLDRNGWEIGYHAYVSTHEDFLKQLQILRKSLKIHTIALDKASYICLQNCAFETLQLFVYYDGSRLLVPSEGDVNDKGGVLQINKPDGKIIYPQNFGCKEFKDFINNMQAGGCYHFRVNPQSYDKGLNYYGKLKEIQIDDQDKVNILTEPAKYDEKSGSRIELPAFFLGGTGRSGTSLLCNILGTHPDIAGIYEAKLLDQKFVRDFPDILFAVPPSERKKVIENYKHFILNTLWRYKADFEVAPNVDEYRGLFQHFQRTEIEEFVSMLDQLESMMEPRDIFQTYGEIIRTLFDRFTVRKEKKIWVEKTPVNSFHASYLRSWFPGLKLIDIIRDGRDVACSLIKVGWGHNDPIKALDWWAETIAATKRSLAELTPESLLQIRYEDLVLNPKETKEQILRFMGLPEKHESLKLEIFEGSVGRWKKDLPEHAKVYASEKYGHLLTSLGYDSN